MGTTADLTDRLRQHYIRRKDMPGGVFVAECGLNSTTLPQRRCDALHIGFTSTSGRLFRGHEIKVTRADWLHELDQLDKASVWADQCHEWYLVTPSAELVRPGELPAGWGHMVPSKRSTVRFDTIVPAERKPKEHNPSWDIVRSVIARLDTIQRNDRNRYATEVRPEIEREARKQAERSVRAGLGDVMTRTQRDRLQRLDELESALGYELGHPYGRNDITVSPEEFAAALRLARAGHAVGGWRGDQPARLADQLDTLSAAVRGLGAELSTFYAPKPAAAAKSA